jgi:bifunctional non-homologous end joining protein LigD
MTQTYVVGGWTDPRGSRPFFGSLLLGVYDEERRLQYVGQTSAGFTDAELGLVWKRLYALKTRTCPFATVPRTTRRPHWAKPRLVVEVHFTGWTKGGELRRPTYAGLKADAKRERAHQERRSIAAETAR